MRTQLNNLERIDLSQQYMEKHRSLSLLGTVVLVMAGLISLGNLTMAWLMLPL